MKRKATSLLTLIAMLAALLPALSASAAASINIGEYLEMGTYYGEPILWRCVDIDSNGPLMLADKIICLKPFDAYGDNTSGSHGRSYNSGYYRKQWGSNYWADSNMRSWLNSNESAGNVTWLCGNPPDNDHVWNGYNDYANEAGFKTNFTSGELGAVKRVTQDSLLNYNEYSDMTPYGSAYHEYSSSISDVVRNAKTTAYRESVMDDFFLLDVNQVNAVYNNGSVLGSDYYIGRPTAKAAANSEYKSSSLAEGNKWHYWLRSPHASYSAGGVRYVDSDGYVYDGDAGDGDVGVRPAFYLNQSSSAFTSGRGTSDSPYRVYGTGSGSVSPTAKPSVTADTNGYMPSDINEVTINYKGTAYGWFEVKNTDGSAAANKTVSYTVDGGKSKKTVTDKYGYACVEVSGITKSKDYAIAISGNGVRSAGGTLSVTVEPLHFKSTYEATVTKGAEVGLSFGVGGSIGRLGAEAEAASIGASGTNKKGISVSQEYKNNKNKLTITAKESNDIAGKAKAGLWAGAKWDKVAGVEASAGDIHGSASYGNTSAIGFEDEDFSINNSGDVQKLSLFMLNVMLESMDSNVAIRYLIDKLQISADTYEKGTTASLAAGASIGDISFKKGDQKVAGVTLGGIDGKSVWSQSTKSSKDGTVSRSSKVAASAGVKVCDVKVNGKVDDTKYSGGTALFSKNFISNDIGFASENDKDGKLSSLSVTYTENKNNDILLARFSEANKRTISYSGDTAKRVAASEGVLNDFVNGNKGFFGTKGTSEGSAAMIESGERGTFKAVKTKTKGLDISASASVELLVKLGGQVGVSGTEGYEFETENGIYDHDFAYIQAHNDIESDAADKFVGLEDIFGIAAGYMSDKIAEYWDVVTGFIDDVKNVVVDTGKAVVEKIDEKVTGWKVSIIKAKEGIGSLFVLAVEDEAALFETSSLAVTVGDPYIITVEDEDGNDVEDFGDTPLMLTLEYTDEDLANAGVTDIGEMAIYRWDEDKCVYVRMGGTLDEAAMNMSLEIHKPGQYILAVDNCPPAVTMFTATTGSSPEITATVSDMSGIASLEMTIDGETVVNNYNADEYYDPATALFSYPTSGLSAGTHTAVIYAEDTSGNFIDGGAVLDFEVITDAPVIENVSEVPQTAAEGFTVEASVNGAAEDMVYLNLEEYTADGKVIRSSQLMTPENGVYSSEVGGIQDNSTVYTWVNAYNSYGNGAGSEKQVTYMSADAPALVLTGGTENTRTIAPVNVDGTGEVIIAQYDGAGALTDVHRQRLDGELEYEKPEAAASVKIMLWDDEMKPLTNFLSW